MSGILETSILDEDLRPLTEVPQLVPSRPNVATAWRWQKRGVRGHKLETVRIGGKLFTSVQAVQRFLEAINEPAEPVRRPRTRRETAAAVKRAKAVLKSAGI